MKNALRLLSRERTGLLVGAGAGFVAGAIAMAALVSAAGITILGG